jgi:hypothetical protein
LSPAWTQYRSRLHGSHLPRRTTVQPTQLSLLPDKVPAPPSDLASQLPEPLTAAAAAILARLITQAVRATPTPTEGTPTLDIAVGGTSMQALVSPGE